MDDECSMRCCTKKTYDTVTLWTVDPSNTSKKGVCRFHYLQRKVTETSIYPVTVFATSFYAIASVTGMLNIEMGLNLPFILVSILTFLLTLSLSGILLLIMAEAVHRVYSENVSVLGRNVRITDEEGYLDSESCCVCGETEVDGIWRKYEYSTEIFGFPIKTKKKGKNIYCSQECRDLKVKEDTSGEEKTRSKNLQSTT